MIKAQSSIIINAPIEKVWKVLTNISNYNEWNPFVYQVEAEKPIPETGTKMIFSVRFDDGKETTSNEYVTMFSPPLQNRGETARWIYRFDGFLHKINMVRATRTQLLKRLPNGTVSYHTEEIFIGWGNKMVPLAQVQRGFERQAEALKVFCEAP